MNRTFICNLHQAVMLFAGQLSGQLDSPGDDSRFIHVLFLADGQLNPDVFQV
ncbi:hypothetical protein D3C71_2171550 [compost metagenome]